jgi:hypothetical protein
MSNLRSKIAELTLRVAELEQADSAESLFFDNPLARSIRNLAESKAISNKVEIAEKAVESEEMKKDPQVIEGEAIIAPPPPGETVKKPGGKEFGTLNQFIVKTEEDVKGVPQSHEEIPKSEVMTKVTDKKQLKKELVKKVVERHLDKKDKVNAIKNVMQDKAEKGEI